MLTNSQYNRIMNEYEAAQSKNRSILREHTQEVFEKIPELKRLDAKSGESALARYRAYASGDEKAIEGFES